jgi:hypothetical protein
VPEGPLVSMVPRSAHHTVSSLPFRRPPSSKTHLFKNIEGNFAEDIRKIGRRLNVDAVLEGSVRKAGNQLRLQPSLIAPRTGITSGPARGNAN